MVLSINAFDSLLGMALEAIPRSQKGFIYCALFRSKEIFPVSGAQFNHSELVLSFDDPVQVSSPVEILELKAYVETLNLTASQASLLNVSMTDKRQQPFVAYPLSDDDNTVRHDQKTGEYQFLVWTDPVPESDQKGFL